LPDNYANFADLAAHRREGEHYTIAKCDRRSRVLIAAPHGGRIEPHTSEIAAAIAGVRHSLYVFHGLVRGLHVTSSHFDEPQALELAGRHATVVTVHGCADNRSRATDVFVGGTNAKLRDAIIRELEHTGFAAGVDRRTAGCCRQNLCNRGFSGAGVQLEITRRLRTVLANANAIGSRKLRAFATAIGRGVCDERPNNGLHPTALGAIVKRRG